MNNAFLCRLKSWLAYLRRSYEIVEICQLQSATKARRHLCIENILILLVVFY